MIDAYQNILVESLRSKEFSTKKLAVMVARLDQIHPIVSGNKLFKLHYYIEAAKAMNTSTIVTLGGAYSNHLAATAFYCKQQNMRSIGIVRGEESPALSHTLINCKENGMQLIFVSRTEYAIINAENIAQFIAPNAASYLFIPEGGFDTMGAKGAAHIANMLALHQPTHVCTAIGTGTTFAGLLFNEGNTFKTIGIPVLKGLTDVSQRLEKLIGQQKTADYDIWDHYHFGGYAKTNPLLLNFMNDFYQQYQIPLDFVYTAKMMYAVMAQIQLGSFPPGSKIICIHTGGLQGNLSLPKGSLVF